MLSLFSKFSQLPTPILLLIIHASSGLCQSLQINQTISLSSSSLSSSTFSLPQSSSPLTISVALCSSPSRDGPRFFVTNNSAVNDPGPNTKDDVFEIEVGDNGIGSVTLEKLSNGGVFGVTLGSGTESFEVGVSDKGSLHSILTSLPLLGDTTSNQVLLFSPPFSPQEINVPKFPNYTLPSANLSSPSLPSQPLNFTLLIGPTSSLPAFNFTSHTLAGDFPVTACALGNRSDLTINSQKSQRVEESVVLRDSNGFRTQWLAEGLQPLTNYTAYVVEEGTKVAGPIFFVTKSAAFSCPLVHSLPYCPLTSYSMPLPPPPGAASSYDASSFPDTVSTPLLSYLTNFTTSLLTFACGRDLYSPLVTCADCQAAYRAWLCAVLLPRCGEESQNSTQTQTSRSGKRAESSQVPLIAPALSPQNSSTQSRNPNLPAFPGGNWTALLPCLETCNAVDRACPNFLGFTCPLPRFNAASSYGVGYVDGDAQNHGGDWEQDKGITGAAQSRWGEVWCNGAGAT